MTHRQAAQGDTPYPVLDLAHLERQTFGEAALEREVLALFREQLRSAFAGVAPALPDRRAATLHRLKGAARGVGAFDLAEKAERLERGDSPQGLRDFEAAANAAAAAVDARIAARVSQG